MVWTVLSAVTAAMQMAVTQLLVTAAAFLDGQVNTEICQSNMKATSK